MPIQNEKQRLSAIADEPISVTVDATDLSLASAEPLRSVISRFGRPVISRAFADFQQGTLAELNVQLYQMGFTLVHCPSWPNSDGVPKTIVSDVMAQDLRDQLEELDEVETFVVVATSRDYIAVANALKRHDRRVVIVGEESKVCRELRLCGDEFVALPPGRPERATRSTSSAARVDRTVELRTERAERFERVERPEMAERVERPIEPRVEPRIERIPEPRPERVERVERLVARPVSRHPVEAPKVERVETPRLETPGVETPQEAGKLPTDADVIAEVRRIVAAEGICTPRRLSRALCPVDKSPTGELRSRIANRIQTLIDAGKLQREKLVVGGTSVETIVVREDRESNGKGSEEGKEAAASLPVIAMPGPSVAETQEAAPAEAAETPQPAPIPMPRRGDSRRRKPTAAAAPVTLGGDLDSLVESVLRSPELAAGLRQREAASSPKTPVAARPGESPAGLPEGPEAAAPMAETPAPPAPKRSRSRRKSPAKAASGEGAEPAPEAKAQ